MPILLYKNGELRSEYVKALNRLREIADLAWGDDLDDAIIKIRRVA